jgi:hypothetical protein
VIAPLQCGAQGKEVNNLNKCLLFLLSKGSGFLNLTSLNPAPGPCQLKELINRDSDHYGPVTKSLIQLFQKNKQLPETGAVNGETAEELNSVLSCMGAFHRQTKYKVSGQVFDSLLSEHEHIAPQGDVAFDADSQGARVDNATDTLQKVLEIPSKFKKLKGNSEALSYHLLRLSIKDGEYTYAKADDIIMIESSDHLTIVHVAQQVGKVKRTIRASCLKDFLLHLPENCFLRVNRFCAVNLKRLSGGSYHQQFFEFDYCITVKPKHPISHAIFNSIGK